MDKLIKNYKFKDFRDAIDFVNQIAKIAETENHHPDISIRFSEVTLEFYTHTTGGITKKDELLSDEINELYKHFACDGH